MTIPSIPNFGFHPVQRWVFGCFLRGNNIGLLDSIGNITSFTIDGVETGEPTEAVYEAYAKARG